MRIGVVPFTQQENFTTLRNGVTGVGFDIARRIQANLAATGVVPIVELLNREDWPGKKDEFFSGNFGAISQAREAGYDLVLLGVLDTLRSMTDLRAFAKVIDVSSGTTVWYGRIEVSTARDTWDERRARFGLSDRNPTRSYFDELLDELARCVAEEAVQG